MTSMKIFDDMQIISLFIYYKLNFSKLSNRLFIKICSVKNLRLLYKIYYINKYFKNR